eukprot:Skav228230  [mRNA]  locus=scaffold3112:7641:10814:+ [translate_table: standard]
MPLLKQGPIIFLAQARQLLPCQLLSHPAATEYQATENVSVCVGRGPETVDDAASEDSGEENNAEVIQLAKERGKEARDGEEVDFDDLDILDELEEAASAIRKERREQRRRRRAAREAWIREAKLEAKNAKRSEAFLEARHLSQNAVHEQPAWLWKQLATDAFKLGNYYQAQFYYTKEAESHGLEPFSVDSLVDTANGKAEISGSESLAVALSNRSHCFARLGHFAAALADARKAAEMRPDWARAWSRVGAAASAGSAEACDAWRKAVELDPSKEHLEGLEAACRRAQKGAGKEQGNEALRARDWHGAIACFTEALATIPPQSTQDGYNLLRCILFSNRSGAFARAGRWKAAVLDAERALAEEQAYPKAYTRLGVALLGCRENEKAYVAFATALKAEERNQAATKGRQACLQLVPQWLSSAAALRRSRFLRDSCRPANTSRVFLLSELRFGHASNEAWVHGIHATKFLDDVLILTGNVADSLRALERGLTALRPKFRRIFYTPGNNEMWITPLESQMFPDSLCKLWAILELCDRLGVDVGPAAVAEGVFVVPLFSWYNPEFDTEDPYAKWPMDANHQAGL